MIHPMLKSYFESIRQTLKTVSLGKVAKETGIGRNTLYAMVRGEHDTVSEKYEILEEYLIANELLTPPDATDDRGFNPRP